MSLLLLVNSRSETDLAQTPYEITSIVDGVPTIGTYNINYIRKSILNDFKELLPRHNISLIRSGKKGNTALEELTEIGKKTFGHLPLNLKNRIKSARSIHLVTNDIVVPWEIMHTGEYFVSLKCSFGISPILKEEQIIVKKDSQPIKQLRVLFVVDSKKNLPNSISETETIQSMLNKNPRITHSTLRGDGATVEAVQKAFLYGNFDIIHFATHAEFEKDVPKESGITLFDGILGPQEIKNHLEGMTPSLIFMNACESARTKELSYYYSHNELTSIAMGFIRAGASSFIGTTRKVKDISAADIGVTFYEHLLSKHTVGESLMMAKKEFFDNDSNDDLSWSAFTLYGDPDLEIDFDSDQHVKYVVPNIEKKHDRELDILEYVEKQNGEWKILPIARKFDIPFKDVKKLYLKHNPK